MITKYLDPKNDLAFKKVFGQAKHKHIPISFLNAALNLQGDDKILDLEFINTIQSPEIESQKESIVDVLVKDQIGNWYIVEMQVAKTPGFEKRAQYYAAKTYCSHFKASDRYVDLKRVVFLAITSYAVFPEKPQYKSEHVILDRKTFEHDLKDFSFTFVELPKFVKEIEELSTLEEQWYYFLKHAEESISPAAANQTIREAYDIVERFNWTPQELMNYDRNMMAICDDVSRYYGAKEEGRQEGRQEGAHQKSLDIARYFFLRGMPLAQIAEAVGISEAELESLLKVSYR